MDQTRIQSGNRVTILLERNGRVEMERSFSLPAEELTQEIFDGMLSQALDDVKKLSKV